MSTTKPRTKEERLGDVKFAFDALRLELTPQPMRDQIRMMTETPVPAPPPEGTTDVALINAQANMLNAYTGMVQASMILGRVVMANDRTALISAVMAMQSGVSRPIIDPEGQV